VQAQLVAAEGLGDAGVALQVARQRREVADVVDALLERAHEARRQRDPVDAEAPQLERQVGVLGEARRRGGLVDRDLDLGALGPGPARRWRARRATCATAAPYLTAARSSASGVEASARSPRSIEWPARRWRRSVGRGLERVPRDALRRRPRAGAPLERVGVVDDVVARVDGEHAVAGREAEVDVGLGLEVVGVGADGLSPTGEEGAGGGVVEHLERRAARCGRSRASTAARRSPPRALGAGRAHGVDVARRGESEPVAEAGRGARAEGTGRRFGSAPRSAARLVASSGRAAPRRRPRCVVPLRTRSTPRASRRRRPGACRRPRRARPRA
jgi:hypothetical protein